MGARVHGVVLAAGRSDRAGGPKALATIDGEPFVVRAVRVLREGGCGEVWVVVAAPFAERIGAEVGGAHVVDNPDPDRGMLSSLQVGLVAALDTTLPPDGVIFSLVDHPRVGADVVRKLVDRFGQTNPGVLRPTHAGRAGHPVLIASAVARKLIDISPRTIVREALAQISPAEDLEIDDASILDDADTAEALRKLRAVLPDE